MRSLRRDFITYGCVVAGGLAIGFSLPRPGWAAKDAAATVAATPEQPSAILGDTDALGMPGLEPMPAAQDGAESPELHALRQAEKQLFGDAPTPKAPVSQPAPVAPDVCEDGTACREDTGNSEWMTGLRMPDLPVHSDVKVARFVHYFTQNPQGRKIFRTWLKRSGRYRQTVETALRERMLPRDLLALVFIESGFSPFATSHAGAVGLWQFMPETARAYGLAVEADYDERRSIARASDAATRHLSDLYEKFGSWELALAAYNMGYKGMLDRVRDTGSNDFWTLAKIDGALPRESQLYVPKIVAVAIVLNNLERFGFDDTHVDGPMATSNLEVPPGIDLATVARAAGTSIAHLHELNPELVGDQIPDRGRSFLAHIPSSGLARAHAMLPRLLDHGERDGLEQEVPRGFDWGRDELPRRDMADRQGGDDLLDAPHPARRAARSWPLDGDDAPTSAPRTVFYRVGEHETLQDVAKMFGTTPQEIIDANYLDPSAKLQKGMLLSLNVRGDVMGRLAKKRASARLDQQEQQQNARGDLDDLAPGDTVKKKAPPEEGDVLRGYALATPRGLPRAPDLAPPAPKGSSIAPDAPRPHSAHGTSKRGDRGDPGRRDGK
jgi:membrane-bound lytic murein transglycosylase D